MNTQGNNPIQKEDYKILIKELENMDYYKVKLTGASTEPMVKVLLRTEVLNFITHFFEDKKCNSCGNVNLPKVDKCSFCGRTL